MKKADYQEYLQSDAWKIRREWKLQRAGHRCQVCNGREDLHVHHRTYDNIGREHEEDLTVLCKDCHALYHGKVSAPNVAPGARSGDETIKRMRAAGLFPQVDVGPVTVFKRGETIYVVVAPDGAWAQRDDRYHIARMMAEFSSYECRHPRQIVLLTDQGDVPEERA
jgi:hypothetical protein